MNGWQISPIFSRLPGLPINVQNMSFCINPTLAARSKASVPNLVPGCNPMVRRSTEWWNPACFVLRHMARSVTPAATRSNNPNYFNLDFSLIKDTKLTEKVNVQLRAEFFDIVNHPNFSVGQQASLVSTTEHINSTTANYQSQLSNPAAYEPPQPPAPAAILCNPTRQTDQGSYRLRATPPRPR